MSGIVRKLDYMRRIVLPREMCDLLYLKPGDLIELNLNNGKIEMDGIPNYVVEKYIEATR